MTTCRTLLALFVLVLCAAVFGVGTTTAGDGFQPVLPDELKMTGDSGAPGAAAILLLRQVDRDDNGKTSHEYNYFRIKILTEEGRKYGDVQIPYVKGQENHIANIRARTIRPDGSIVNFNGKVFDQTIEKTKSYKFLAKTFTLPEVQPGCVIEYFYTLDIGENALYDSHWILSDELFTKHAKFSLKPYAGSDTRWTIRWSWQGLPPGTEQPKQGADHVVRLESSNIPAFQEEEYMPPENELKSRVDFYYSDETPESDLNKFWKGVGKKLNGTAENYSGKRKEMEAAVAQIVSPGDTPEVKAQKIYARVQQMKNLSYVARKTEEERKRDKDKNLTNAEEMLKRNEGYGYGLTWLYLSLVRAAGIEAYPAMVSDRSNYFFSPNLMDKSKLDANVVLLKLNGKDVYCDPGAAFTPFGLLPWPETGVKGLKLDKDGGAWIVTSLPESSASKIERKAQLKLTETGDLEGKLTVTYTGLQASRRRVEERNDDEAGRKKFLEEQIKEYIPAASEVELTNKPEWNSSSPAFVTEYDIKVPGWAAAAGKREILSVGLFSAAEKRLFEHAHRVHPIYFEFPYQKVDDITIELPAGIQVSSLPKPMSNDGHVILYTMKAENASNTVHVSRSLNVDFLTLEAKYYPALQNFFQTVKSGDEAQIVLQPGTAAASK